MPPFFSWHIPGHKSQTVVHDLLRFGGCRAIFLYFLLFSAIYFSVRERTLGSILWAQTPSNWPHHGSSFRQAWPKEYSGLCGGWDRSRQTKATVCQMRPFWKSGIIHCTSGLLAQISSFPRAEIFFRSCLTKATSMVGSIGGSLGSHNLPQSPFL